MLAERLLERSFQTLGSLAACSDRGDAASVGAPLRATLDPRAFAPYFGFVALVHAAAVASRFDLVAEKLPVGAPLAIMLAQFPLLFLSGYFEGRLDYGERHAGFPRWMQINSKAVKLAFAFGFMYLAVVVAQVWDVKIGPIDPSPPKSFPAAQRAMWFATFTAGFFFLFYLAAASLLIPVLRTVTAPLRMVPAVVGALIALAVGGAVGVGVMAAVQSTEIAGFIGAIKAAIKADPALMIAVTLGAVFVPLVLGLVLKRRAE